MMNTSNTDRNNWLHELSNQSWNLELIVSGAALFSTSFLPGLIDDAINNYLENYLASNNAIDKVLPILALSFAKSAAYLLILAFFVHFIYRAFWIALVGLRAVYPQGIVYDKIHNTTEKMRNTLRGKFGNFDDYIIKLDQKCSQIFSIAFVIVLFSIIMAFIYFFAFLFIFGFKTYFPDLYAIFKPFFKWLALAICFLGILITIVVSQKKLRERPTVERMLNIMIDKSSLIYMGLYKPINYINLVFSSNLTRKKYMTTSLGLMILFYFIGIIIYINILIEQKGIPLGETRKHYSHQSSVFSFNEASYDNLRGPLDRIDQASIQSEIIEDPFIKLFIKYEKHLDAEFSEIITLPDSLEKLTKYRRRILTDSLQLSHFNSFFQISINDSIIHDKEFFYDTRSESGTKGLITFLNSEYCKKGKNILSISKRNLAKKDSVVYDQYTIIPFWYNEKN